jgi:coenzyme F420-0:L-glutamate ligase/coenzyme F420-1:gamma-L-glutamate ligase
VSKAEGRVERTDDHLAVILREARAVRRRRDELVIAETEHGFVCASAGVVRSNTPGDEWVVLLPRDPDARLWPPRTRARFRACRSHRLVRPRLSGDVDVAISVAGAAAPRPARRRTPGTAPGGR